MGKKFLIYMSNFDPSSGGQVAMHKLCHDINEVGGEAFITSTHTHPKLNAPFLGGVTLPIDDCVIIYPEIVHGNPINAKHVVRWILNTPGNCGGVGRGFYENKKDTDLVYKYSTFFEYNGLVTGMMRTSYIDFDLFKNNNTVRDIKECFFIKKGGMTTNIHSNDAIDFSRFQSNWVEASNILNRCETFYCYDNECFWVTLAALCGCVVVVIPNTELPSGEWKEHFPFNKYGIAFGMDELQWAKDTISLVHQNCLDQQEKDKESIRKMMDDCDKL